MSHRESKCSSQPIGKNTFGKFPKIIARLLNLEDAELYTGHCFRRTSVTLLANSGANIDILKRHGGWKSATVAMRVMSRITLTITKKNSTKFLVKKME